MTLGLSLIARDEEKMLPGLLESIDGAFDQVVLLDTGSTDATAQIFIAWAKDQPLALGFKLEQLEWRDDFAAAKSAADKLLDTDWECWGEADETFEGADLLSPLLKSVPGDCLALGVAWHGDPTQPRRWSFRERVFRAGRGVWFDRAHPRKYVPEYGLIAKRPHPALGLGEAWPKRAPVIPAQISPHLVSVIHRRDWRRAGSVARERELLHRWAREEPENLEPAAQLDRLARLSV